MKLNMKNILSLTLLFMLILFTGCSNQTDSPSYFQHKSGLYFDYPGGWSELSKKEWREHKMGKDQTLITIMDEDRMAGFAIIPVTLSRADQQTSRILDDEVEARVVVFLESIDEAAPNKYHNYELIKKGAASFAGIPVGEIVYQGKLPGKSLRWYRILIAVADNIYDKFLMIVLTAPMGEQDDFLPDFLKIEDTWKWKK